MVSRRRVVPETAEFTKYIENKRILIADESAVARTGLHNVFSELGAKPEQLILTTSYKEAAEQITTAKPHIVIAEYELGRRCGLDLLQTQRSQLPNETKQMLFVLVTGNTSQTAVARAAEEDIDAYILKPFTVETVCKTIIRTALLKISPPQYLRLIETGKVALSNGSFDEADRLFKAAAKLDSAPSLAHYYMGQVNLTREVFVPAKESYKKGLGFNKIHYKCMVGLYETLMKEKSHAEAYDIVKRISQFFPANPKRLSDVLHLAIVNAKYEDVETYYNLFIKIDDRDESLIKYICAALVVCGKHYLNAEQTQRALELFAKAAKAGTGSIKILREIVQALLEFKLTTEAKRFLETFPPESRSSEDYKSLQSQIVNAESRPS